MIALFLTPRRQVAKTPSSGWAIVSLFVICHLSPGCTSDYRVGDLFARTVVYEQFAHYEQVSGDADYVDLLARSVARDESAIRLFLASEKQLTYDGAASEGHAAVLGFLLRHTGDSFFGRALTECPTEIQESVRENLHFDMAYAWDERYQKNAEEQLRYQYPITFALEQTQ